MPSQVPRNQAGTKAHVNVKSKTTHNILPSRIDRQVFIITSLIIGHFEKLEIGRVKLD